MSRLLQVVGTTTAERIARAFHEAAELCVGEVLPLPHGQVLRRSWEEISSIQREHYLRTFEELLAQGVISATPRSK